MTIARAYTTVFFDLDGTLLPIDTGSFLRAYMKGLGAFMGTKGMNPEEGVKAVLAGVKAMGDGENPATNCEKFWATFEAITGLDLAHGEEMFLEFYNGPFNDIAQTVTPNPAAARAINTLKAKGYRIALTTMPMFPLTAVHNRVRWAGLNPEDFEFVTDYATNSSVKPFARFYQEALERAGANANEVLMVGNHNLEDGAATKLGMDIYLVTDHLIESGEGLDVAACKHGSMEDFARFCEELPSLN